MRYRIYFPTQSAIEFDCYRFDFHPKADRRLRLYMRESKHLADCVDLFLAEIPMKICDDHGRIVWPNAEAVIEKARTFDSKNLNP